MKWSLSRVNKLWLPTLLHITIMFIVYYHYKSYVYYTTWLVSLGNSTLYIGHGIYWAMLMYMLWCFSLALIIIRSFLKKIKICYLCVPHPLDFITIKHASNWHNSKWPNWHHVIWMGLQGTSCVIFRQMCPLHVGWTMSFRLVFS